jgi:hypothetical protein
MQLGTGVSHNRQRSQDEISAWRGQRTFIYSSSMLMWPVLGREKDSREKLGEIRGGDGALDAYLEIVKEMKQRMDVSFLRPILDCDNKYSS